MKPLSSEHMPASAEIEAIVRRILVEEFEVDPAALRPDAMLGKDLDLDSLDGVDLVVALEKAFHCRISEEEASGIRSLGDIHDRIRARLAASNAGSGSAS